MGAISVSFVFLVGRGGLGTKPTDTCCVEALSRMPAIGRASGLLGTSCLSDGR
jgi:hypothetical protein